MKLNIPCFILKYASKLVITAAFSVLLLLFQYNIFSQEVTISTTVTGFIVDIVTPIPLFKKINLNDSVPLLSKATYIYQKGAPELPKISESFVLNHPERFLIEIIDDDYTDITAAIAPSKGFVYQDNRNLPREAGEVYILDAFFPVQVYKDFDPVMAHGEYRQTCWFFPLQYNPVTKKLRIHRHLRIKLTLKTHVLQTQRFITSQKPQLRSMLIIAHENFSDALKPFVQWKNQTGIRVRIHTLQSVQTAVHIKNIVMNEYKNEKFDYLLLAGDDQIPAYPSVYGSGDYPYGLLEGDDNYADIDIGRFPASSKTELVKMINKSVQYEKALNPGKWLTSFCGISSSDDGNNSGDNGESDSEHIMNLAALFNTNNFDTELIQQGDPDSKAVSCVLDKGCGFVFYTGHGNGTSWKSIAFTNDSVKQLNNYPYSPVIIDASCLNGGFSNNTCLAEQFMKDTIGSVAYLGSTISMLWAPPMLGQDRIAQGLFIPDTAEPKVLGAICRYGFYEMIDEYDDHGAETAFTWVLFGDPSLTLWNSLPEKISVAAPDVVDISQDTLKAVTENGCLITLVLDTLLLDYAMVNNHTASLYHESKQTIDSLLLTVTKNQHIPFIRSLKPYNDSGSYYNVREFHISDENNNLAENNEWISVSLNISNYGNETGKEIVVQLISTDAVLEIEKSTIMIDSISGNSMVTVNGFRVRTTSMVSDSSIASLQVNISDNSGQQNAKIFTLPIYAPEVSISALTLDNLWNVKPETIKQDTGVIYVIVNNTGHAASNHTKCQFIFNDMYVEHIDKPFQLTNIPAFSSDTVRFRFKILDNCYPGHNFTSHVFLEENKDEKFTLSFYYSARPDLIKESSDYLVRDYPFYNYYLASRTQIIYNDSDFLNHSLIIDSIGFNMAEYTNYSMARELNNFAIKLVETDITHMNYYFLDTKSIQPVFSQENYSVPDKKGWLFFDINDTYYSGDKPLLLELSWGINDVAASYYDAFSVYCHETRENSVGYGYNDFVELPELKSCSKLRPDIFLAGRKMALHKIKIVVADHLYSQDTDTLYLIIGEQQLKIGRFDSLYVELPAAQFSYSLYCSSHRIELQSGTFKVMPDTRYIQIGKISPVKKVNKSNEEVSCTLIKRQLLIELPEKNMNASVFIFDLSGRIVYQQIVNSNSFREDLSLISGIYVVYLKSENEVFYRGKIILW